MIKGAVNNVLDFGADPTGVADSTAAFNLATKAAYQGTGIFDQNIPGGVFVPPGIYKISTTVFVHKGQHLFGAGEGASKIDASGMTAYAGPVFKLGYASTGVVDVGGLPPEISELWVYGGPQSYAIVECAVNGYTIHNMFMTSPGVGLSLGGTDGRVSNIQIDQGLTGMRIDGHTHQINQVAIWNCNYGIFTQGSSCVDIVFTNLALSYLQYGGIIFSAGVETTNLNFTACSFVMNEQFGTFSGYIITQANGASASFNSCDFSNMKGPVFLHQTGIDSVFTFNNCAFNGGRSLSAYSQSTTSYVASSKNESLYFNSCFFNGLKATPIQVDGGSAIAKIYVKGGLFNSNAAGETLFGLGATAPEPNSVLSVTDCTFTNEGQAFPASFSNSWNLATDHWQVINGNGATTASVWPSGDKSQYFVNTSSLAASVRLPRSDSIGIAQAHHGNQLTFTDYGRNWATNNVTFLRGDNTINGAASNLVANTNGQTITFTFNGFTNDWITS